MAGSVTTGILDDRQARLLRLGLRFNPFSKTTPLNDRVVQTFVGRVDDLRRAAQALGDGSRNVLVLGGYGLGKTAFMIKLLAELRSSTRDFLTAYAPVTADLSEAVLRALRGAVLALPDVSERVRESATAEVGHTVDERRAQFVELLDLTTDVAPRVVIAIDEVDKRDAESVRSMLGGARPILDTRASFLVAARPLGLFRQMDAPVMAAFDRRIDLSLLSDEEGRALVANYLRTVDARGLGAAAYGRFVLTIQHVDGDTHPDATVRDAGSADIGPTTPASSPRRTRELRLRRHHRRRSWRAPPRPRPRRARATPRLRRPRAR